METKQSMFYRYYYKPIAWYYIPDRMTRPALEKIVSGQVNTSNRSSYCIVETVFGFCNTTAVAAGI